MSTHPKASVASRQLRAALALSLLVGISCVDAPFERSNPNDFEFDYTMQIVASRDTLTLDNRYAVLRVLTTPATAGYQVAWSVEPEGVISILGNGIFEYVGGTTTVPVTVTASFRAKSATYVLVRAAY